MLCDLRIEKFRGDLTPVTVHLLRAGLGLIRVVGKAHSEIGDFEQPARRQRDRRIEQDERANPVGC
ncbi:hypothetical protein EV641_102220 [Rhodococcus sp. SMB37]|nr:hypothetical protein EV641_102220 [Rhodococcus sp. SMB37]